MNRSSADSTPCNTPAMKRKGMAPQSHQIPHNYASTGGAVGGISAHPSAALHQHYNTEAGMMKSTGNGAGVNLSSRNGCENRQSLLKRKSGDCELDSQGQHMDESESEPCRFKRLNSCEDGRNKEEQRPEYFVKAPATVGMDTSSPNAHRFISSMCTY
eukprot:Nk52_evm33s1020 gene=Nk52_evmTU33s1020